MWEGKKMGESRQILIVDLSGDQKSFLGYASWKQVGITGAGIFLGCIIFSFIKWLCKLSGAGLGTQVATASFFFILIVAPFAYLAFVPVRDNYGDILYYKWKQVMIDRNFLKKEVGTYINLQHPIHPVNSALPYAIHFHEEEE